MRNGDCTEKVLRQFNQEPLEVINDSLMIDADSTLRILILGNSITLHKAVEEESDDRSARGLASTRKEMDYVHQLVGMIAEDKHWNVRYSYANIAEFERRFVGGPYDVKRKLSKSEIQDPDILIVQIGENVAKDDLQDSSLFRQRYMELLANFPNSIRIITLPFWPDGVKQEVITEVALESKSFLVDLTHLGDGTDTQNFASSHKHYTQPGVGAHPGDYGMKNIARCLYTVIGALKFNDG
jgi:hypothetical protein